MNPQRVLFFQSAFNLGGEARAMRALARGFARRGNEVLVFALEKDGDERDIPHVRFTAAGTTRASRAGLAFIRALWRFRPHVVVTSSTQTNVVAILAVRLFFPSATIVMTEHTVVGWLTRNHPTLKRRVTGWLGRMAYRAADHIVAVSQAVVDELRVTLPFARVVLIQNSVLNHELQAGAACPPRHPWLRAKEAPVIVALGHLIEPKGFDILIKAFRAVHRKTGARLVIFGDGHQRANLEALVGDLGLAHCVDLPGVTTNPYAEIAAADMLVSASLVEAAPLTICEALCLGVPVVAANAEGGIAEILGHGRFGRLVPIKDSEALGEAMLNRLNEARGHEASAAVQEFSEDRVMDRWEALLGISGARSAASA